MSRKGGIKANIPQYIFKKKLQEEIIKISLNLPFKKKYRLTTKRFFSNILTTYTSSTP